MADTDPTTDAGLTDRIGELVARERELREQGGLDDDGRAELEQLRVALDRTWDLLRQRRAKEEFGDNPDEAKMRPAQDVEGYRQ